MLMVLRIYADGYYAIWSPSMLYAAMRCDSDAERRTPLMISTTHYQHAFAQYLLVSLSLPHTLSLCVVYVCVVFYLTVSVCMVDCVTGEEG